MLNDNDIDNGSVTSETEGNQEPEDDVFPSGNEPDKDFPIVGIGASAGGLTAFEQLFRTIPPDSGIAFVVVQHLSTTYKSILPEILQRFTTMPVTQVTEGVEIKPNGVYVIPPGSNLSLRDGHLRLTHPETDQGIRLAIDIFFRSLAEVQSTGAIGIVLSGTGSDGSLGLKSIKAEGGLTIAQEPGTAEFGDMPRNAIATKDVDFILPPEKMGELILRYLQNKSLDGYQRGDEDLHYPPAELQKLYSLLRSKTGHDFSLYKQNTILRRIERRMKVCLVKDLEDYIEHLQKKPDEVDALFREMLINVTHFFRNPEAFQALAEKAIQPLIVKKQIDCSPFRVWVAGCSSGEEAYSIAIAIQEIIDAEQANCKITIFATDLDAEAIETARRGFYTDGSLETVSAERLQRFFTQEEDGYRIKNIIRDMVVFSTQDLIADPAISKIDLLSCRNVLIYLEHELQKQLLARFHYSLNPDGILFLGNSESISGKNSLFGEIDRKHKIFKRKGSTTQSRPKVNINPLIQRTGYSDPDNRVNRPKEGGLREWMEKALLEFHTPACVLTDQKHNIVYVHGRTGKYLEPVPGEMNSNLIRMAREGLKTELATAIHTSATKKEVVRREGIRVKTNGDYQPIDLTVRQIKGPSGLEDLIMVVFEEANVSPGEAVSTVSPGEAENAEEGTNPRIIQLENELNEKDEYLHTIIDELEDTNQDLKSTNEELQSINEEMQSTNEELETSTEELQSINEELITINAELQNKNEELTSVNNDIYNLLSSIEIGIIFLDLDLHIRRFTPAINRIYHFLSADIGRPIDHFVSSLEYPELVPDIREVLRTLVPKAIEVQAKDGAWYLINIRPYRTIDNVIDGAVVTFVDISEQKSGDTLRRLGTILRDSNDAITVHDFLGKILAWNRGATRMYGWNESEALTMNALDLFPKNKRDEMIALYNRLAMGEVISSIDVQKKIRSGRILDVWMTLTTLVDDAGHPVAVASTERDITDHRPANMVVSFENRALKAFNKWYRVMLDPSKHTSHTVLEAACRSLVDVGGYRMAMIGRVEKDKAKTITPLAWAGFEESIPQLFAGKGRGSLRAATEKALRSGDPVIERRRSSDRPAVRNGHSPELYLIIPIIYQNDPSGLLLIYASEPEAFVDAEVACLVEFSNQITQAIHRDGEGNVG